MSSSVKLSLHFLHRFIPRLAPICQTLVSDHCAAKTEASFALDNMTAVWLRPLETGTQEKN